jgi:hypothetical protein
VWWAAIRLTSCFVYSLVGALASDAQAADESEDGVCLLSAETAQSAVRALCDTAGLLLEYLENVLDDGTDVTGDPDTRLAVTRAVGSFLAELPDPHASRLDSILPKLLSHHAAPGAMCPDQASRALTTRFMLPYLLQRTEDPHGLEGEFLFIYVRAIGLTRVFCLQLSNAPRDRRRWPV